MDNLNSFRDVTAARLAPDRATRWLKFFDEWSANVPEAMPESEFANLTLSAWIEFRKRDAETQADAIARAWGVKRTEKFSRMRFQPRKKFTVVKPVFKPYERCIHWGGTRTDCPACRGELGTTHETHMQKAESLFQVHANFVRKYIRVELMPWSEKRYDVNDIEGLCWFNVARRMPEYLPLLKVGVGSTETIGTWEVYSTEQERARAQMWLRSVVHSTIIDVIRGNHLKEGRNIDREVPLPDSAADQGIPNPADPPPAIPTATASMRNLAKGA